MEGISPRHTSGDETWAKTMDAKAMKRSKLKQIGCSLLWLLQKMERRKNKQKHMTEKTVMEEMSSLSVELPEGIMRCRVFILNAKSESWRRKLGYFLSLISLHQGFVQFMCDWREKDKFIDQKVQPIIHPESWGMEKVETLSNTKLIKMGTFRLNKFLKSKDKKSCESQKIWVTVQWQRIWHSVWILPQEHKWFSWVIQEQLWDEHWRPDRAKGRNKWDRRCFKSGTASTIVGSLE